MKQNREYRRDKRSPIPKNDTVSKVQASVKGKGTQPEVFVRKYLYNLGARGYRVNYNKIPGSPDVVFVKKKIAVFVQGCFWHGCSICGARIPKHNSEYWGGKIKKNIERDSRNYLALKRMQYSVFYVWEHEIKGRRFESLMNIYRAYIDQSNQQEHF